MKNRTKISFGNSTIILDIHYQEVIKQLCSDESTMVAFPIISAGDAGHQTIEVDKKTIHYISPVENM